MRIFKIDELEIMDNMIYSTANIGQELLDTCLYQPNFNPNPVSIRRDTKLGDLVYIKNQLAKYPDIIYKYDEYTDATNFVFNRQTFGYIEEGIIVQSFHVNWRRIKWIYSDLKILDLSMYDIAVVLILMKYSNIKLSKIMKIIDDDIYSFLEPKYKISLDCGEIKFTESYAKEKK